MIVIAGPCVIEENIFHIACSLKNVISEYKNIDFYFKASCIKDNRTSIHNYSGVGFLRGIEILHKIRKKIGVKITTDFHDIKQITEFGSAVDLIQIPAFLCQQTSLLKEAIKQNKPIHIKKGQFLSPASFVDSVVKKYVELNGDLDKLFITDRGTSFGYETLIMDPRHVLIMKQSGGKVLVDTTHPNKNSLGKDKYEEANILATSYIISGADGIFMEVHDSPLMAKCDANTIITILEFNKILEHSYKCFKMKEEIDAKYK